MCAHQRDWAKLIDGAQFSYNLQWSEATSKIPFETMIQQQPMTPSHCLDLQREGPNNPYASQGVA